MPILFIILPLILVGTGVAILFWPRKPLRRSEPVGQDQQEGVDKPHQPASWTRFLLAIAFMALALALAIFGQNQAG